MYSHYSKAQSPKEMYSFAKKAAKALIEWADKNNYHPVLCYSGMSGIATATAISIALHNKRPSFEYGMIYVRKENEKSHGFRTEMANADCGVLVFVDDFIDSGDTMKYVCAKVSECSPEVVQLEIIPKLLSGVRGAADSETIELP